MSEQAPGPRVAIVAEFYPSRRDPVMGIWAHRQALATRDAGAEVRVIVLHRVVPPRSALSEGIGHAGETLAEMLSEPRHQTRDGLEVVYAPYVSPPRERGYPGWGAWAAPTLAFALLRMRRSFPYELIHAHNAVPAGDAVRRASPRTPLIVSEHGADVLYTAWRGPRGARAVARGLGAAQLVLANSRGVAELARGRGAGRTQVVHLGAALPPPPGPPAAQTAAHHGYAARSRPSTPTLVTVAHLVARKRHADVLRALAVLRPRHPTLRYSIVGDGPERHALEVLSARLG
ncbi:MAG TPA: glycosyltransferase, partial [Solirubrobacteraceae bacterium]|nr:glycosyltransferase [Solirubrobacteraceae bacterium]